MNDSKGSSSADISLEEFRILDACKAYYFDVITAESLSNLLKNSGEVVKNYGISNSYEEMLSNVIEEVVDAIDDEIYLYWYDFHNEGNYFKVAVPTEARENLKDRIAPYLERIRKLIVRGIYSDSSMKDLKLEEEEVTEWLDKHEILSLCA